MSQTTSNLKKLIDNHSKSIEIEGHQLNVIDVGEGIPILVQHGFPNSAVDWHNQIKALVDNGYRAIAPDLLGLGESDKPDDLELYTAAKDTERTIAILDALEIDRLHIVCHDRGSAPGWAIAAYHPERVLSLTSLTVGHIKAWADMGIDAREQAWYMLFFQFKAAETQLAADDFKLFRDWMRHHPSVDDWVAKLSRPGALKAGISWYRANMNPDKGGFEALPNIEVPTQILWSPDDFYATAEQALSSWQYCQDDFRCVRVNGATHFMMLDRPDFVNQAILEWIQKHSHK